MSCNVNIIVYWLLCDGCVCVCVIRAVVYGLLADIGPVSITTDPKKFQQDLQELFVQVGARKNKPGLIVARRRIALPPRLWSYIL